MRRNKKRDMIGFIFTSYWWILSQPRKSLGRKLPSKMDLEDLIVSTPKRKSIVTVLIERVHVQ